MTTGSSSWIRREKRLALYLRDAFACGYCGRDLRDAEPREVTLDHLIPRTEGGSNEASNLITACLSCNSSRQDKPWQAFASRINEAATIQIENRVLLPIEKFRELALAILADRTSDTE